MDGFSLKWLAKTALKLIKSVKLTFNKKFLSGHEFNCSLLNINLFSNVYIY